MSRLKQSFTLLEILLVVALIGLTLGVISIQFPKALRGETFERGIDQVKSKIALAQELMLNYQTDVVLTLKSTDKGVISTIETAKPISQQLKQNINRHQVIKGIEEIGFDDRLAETTVLNFDGTLGAPPKGKLILKGKNKEATLTLKGFPSQLLRGDHVTEDSQAAYPEEILPLI